MMRDIPGYKGLYAAKEDGTVWSLRRGRALKLKPYYNAGGYRKVNLYRADGSVRHEYVHRLIASTFLPNPKHLNEVNHLNADRSDNRASNLEWCDHRDNLAYALKNGRWSKKIAVRATSISTGEVREYPFLKHAAADLFGRPFRLQYERQLYGDRFTKGDWRIEVLTDGV